LGISLPLESIPVKINGNADVSSSIEEGMQTSVNSISEVTTRASERFKNTSKVKVVQTRETGREERVTRHIKNQNLGRTLTLNCFEINEHYDVITRQTSSKPKFILLVEFPRPKTFDLEFVLANEDKLRKALLSTVYQDGFGAAKKKLAQRIFDNSLLIKTEIEVAQTKLRAEQASSEEPTPTIIAVAKSIKKIFKDLQDLDLVKEFDKLAHSYIPFGPAVTQAERATANDALGKSNFWLKFKMVTPGIESKAIEFVKLPDQPTAKQAYEALQALVPGLDDEWVTSVKTIAASYVVYSLSAGLFCVFPWLLPIALEFALIENNMGLPGLIEKAKKEVKNYEMTASIPLAGQPNAAGTAAVPPALAAPQLYSLSDIAESEAEFQKLVLHLDTNAVYYMNAIISQEDANVRYEKLKIMGLQNAVENTLLGFVGRKAVFPLQINSLEQETKNYLQMKLIAGWVKNSKVVLPVAQPIATSVSLPTGGLYMEASLGQCDALEPHLVDSRLVELASAKAQVDQMVERTKQLAIETKRRQAKLDANDLTP
jgi:hypothetical protein